MLVEGTHRSDPAMRMNPLTVVLRSVLGLMFVAGPLATALHLTPEPTLPPAGAAFLTALAKTGYMLPLLWSTEIAAGILLLSGVLAPLGVVLLAPVIVNIAGFHLFLAPQGVPPAIAACVLEVFLAWQYRRTFLPLLRADRPQEASRERGLEVRSA
jgi:putative oxidoreductase